MNPAYAGLLRLRQDVGHHGNNRVRHCATGAEVLRRHVLLRGMRAGERSRLLGAGHWVLFQRDQVISRQTSPVDEVLFIVEGSAKAEVSSAAAGAGDSVGVSFVGPGDDIGLLSVVDGARHSATVTALDEVRAFSLPVGVIKSCLGSSADWNRRLAQIAVARLRTSADWLYALI